MSRRFSQTQRAALYLAAGGQCEHCGTALKKGFHADHRLAWSLGGATVTGNGDATCPSCNLTKAARLRPLGLRDWQADALAKWSTDVPRDFLAVATPGAGKTRFAGVVAARALAVGLVDVVIVVVPTERLKYQWADSLASANVNLEPEWRAAHGALPEGMDGVVVTYAQLGVGTSAEVLAHHLGRRPGLAILDEVHHCGADLTWGDGIETAFVGASHRLSLSGTPFRSDDHQIPFVTYDGANRGRADYTYEYTQALADDVVRPVWFPTRGGRVEWAELSGEVRSASFEELLDDREVNRRLTVALHPEGDWLASVLDDACADLDEIRRTDPDAGGLVLARDTQHAEAIAGLMKERHGCEPLVVTSAEADSRERIEAFTTSSDPWMVAVRMVSEGVDIPRLRVGVYATTVATELFFRQAVGRFVRVEEAGAGEHAVVFIPDDPRLRLFAATIAEMRDHVLAAEVAHDEETDVQRETQGGGRPAFVPIASESMDTGGIVSGQAVAPSLVAEARRVLAGLDQVTAQRFTVGDVALILGTSGRALGDGDSSGGQPAEAVPRWRRSENLRGANNKAARALAYEQALDFATVNRRLNQAVGIDKLRNASTEQLQRRLETAQRWRSGTEPGRLSDQATLFDA